MRYQMWCSLLLVSAVGCYSNQTVGVSKGKGKEVAPPPAFKPKIPTQIVAKPGEMVNFFSPSVGDMDGDGFDDFILLGQQELLEGTFDQTNLSMYLFYGRPQFPEQISSADADAVFAVESQISGPVGDVNGDGLGDLMLMRSDSVEFVLGSEQRFHGAIEPKAAGPVWMAGELPPPFAPGFISQFMVQPIGDVDGDGCADLAVGATGVIAPEGDGSGGGLVMRCYLMRGHRGDWASGVWDPSWATAGFGFESSTSLGEVEEPALLYPERIGDLDGDGRSDLIAASPTALLMFYGRSEFAGELSASDAEARIELVPERTEEFSGFDVQPSLLTRGFGDLDGDGSDDLAMLDMIEGSVSIAYGARWSGETRLKPELTIALQAPGQQHVNDLATGDVDGDGFPELIVSVGGYTDEELDRYSGIYVIRGTGERLVGRRQLTSSYLWRRPPPAEIGGSGEEGTMEIRLAGDVDGDGGQDILTNLLITKVSGELDVSLHLVPSTPRAPD